MAGGVVRETRAKGTTPILRFLPAQNQSKVRGDNVILNDKFLAIACVGYLDPNSWITMINFSFALRRALLSLMAAAPIATSASLAETNYSLNNKNTIIPISCSAEGADGETCSREFTFKPSFTIEPEFTGSISFTNTPVTYGDFTEEVTFVFSVVSGRPIESWEVYLYASEDDSPAKHRSVCSIKSISDYKIDFNSSVIQLYPSIDIKIKR